MRACKHEDMTYAYSGPDGEVEECRKCESCGTWFSLGPANDDSEAVKIEIRAAEIVALHLDDRHPFPLSYLSDAERDGWLTAILKDLDDELLWSDDELAGYLGYRIIATHDENRCAAGADVTSLRLALGPRGIA